MRGMQQRCGGQDHGYCYAQNISVFLNLYKHHQHMENVYPVKLWCIHRQQVHFVFFSIFLTQNNNLSFVRIFPTKNLWNEVIDNQNDTNQYLQHENLRLIFVKVNRGAKKTIDNISKLYILRYILDNQKAFCFIVC